jgi:hypothetical protein
MTAIITNITSIISIVIGIGLGSVFVGTITAGVTITEDIIHIRTGITGITIITIITVM